ncbi:MAG TPA: hypothetical protein PLV25_07730, partial [Opitutales bacterium]|nr:hypothetical protein [Opitutales bacterium]
DTQTPIEFTKHIEGTIEFVILRDTNPLPTDSTYHDTREALQEALNQAQRKECKVFLDKYYPQMNVRNPDSTGDLSRAILCEIINAEPPYDQVDREKAATILKTALDDKNNPIQTNPTSNQVESFSGRLLNPPSLQDLKNAVIKVGRPQ